ncbi:unnamed protein product [Kuraishia capsulata CBS 1993]|uniref:Uncharacterized protein n=1 Tax=Kuraishia capsulata CBS 1993 TaxID=1382522 RepID=W6MQE8_9ASCO|nr:uncharacterized protein KUCA_T00004965001 [Kuraishia capsulata CBS 1993]CDK28979.1 unnamed protein product [Kuraishia capsulata CBS 1993]
MLSSPELIILHIGAGKHSLKNEYEYRRLMKRAIKAYGHQETESSGVLKKVSEDDLIWTQYERLLKATDIIEKSPLTNTGFGSSLNYEGEVECDACILVSGSKSTQFSLSNQKSSQTPIRNCYNRYRELVLERPAALRRLGFTPPVMVVETDDGDKSTQRSLVSPKALQMYLDYREKLEIDFSNFETRDFEINDTVGAICLTRTGHTFAASSSGGNTLKYPGRLGCASIVGASIFACSNDDVRVSVMCSGNGEDIIQADLARYCCRYILDHSRSDKMVCVLLEEAISGAFEKVQLTAVNGERSPIVYAGAVGFLQRLTDAAPTSVFYAYTTESFVFAFSSPGSGTLDHHFLTNKKPVGHFQRGEIFLESPA